MVWVVTRHARMMCWLQRVGDRWDRWQRDDWWMKGQSVYVTVVLPEKSTDGIDTVG